MSLPLIALFVAAFAFGTAEFVIAGVLPEVATGLTISIPTAGYLVTGYAVGIALGGPVLAVFSKKLSRKTLILGLSTIFTIGQVLCALAPNFETLMAARVLVAAVHGTYFGVASIVATGLVPPHKRGSAVALILSGLTVSTILGVPGGTAIGNVLGWRATFWAVGGLGLLATIAIALYLPKTISTASTRSSFRREFKALGRQQIILSLLIVILAMIGQASIFTYIAPLLLTITGVDASLLPWLLLLLGTGSTIGVFAGGRLADWRLMPSLITILALLAAIHVVLFLASPYPLPMAIAMFVWGGINFSFSAPVQSRVLQWAGDAPNLASSLIPTGFNIGIAIGAAVGGLVLQSPAGYRALPWVGAGTLTLAFAVAFISYVWERRTGAIPPSLAATPA
ncbi:MFS transporter [Devosia rhodophyticola]|uniref:MFS transporter n=1 Tax=Devosia rhodophyticola TaxID=3026423 RepID=A0ABY7YUX5_9HYPH|nr:MFS transporter [Devosia rhodophyticola]WDR05163.1 MFS transporter [Devosia rhodophyticola]